MAWRNRIVARPTTRRLAGCPLRRGIHPHPTDRPSRLPKAASAPGDMPPDTTAPPDQTPLRVATACGWMHEQPARAAPEMQPGCKGVPPHGISRPIPSPSPLEEAAPALSSSKGRAGGHERCNPCLQSLRSTSLCPPFVDLYTVSILRYQYAANRPAAIRRDVDSPTVAAACRTKRVGLKRRGHGHDATHDDTDARPRTCRFRPGRRAPESP